MSESPKDERPLGLFYTPVICLIPTYTPIFPLVFLLPTCQYIDMVCIYCSNKTQVSNSRHQKRSNTVWRRRQCMVCQSIFTTVESVEEGSSFTYKNTAGSLEPLERDHILMAVYDSLKHRKTALSDATALTATIMSMAYKNAANGVIDRDNLVAICSEVLQRFDTVAATHYAAFHPISK